MFYALAKLFWLLVNPYNFILILLCLAVLLLWSRWQRFGLWFVSLVTSSLLAVAVLPVGHWLLYPLNNQFSPFVSSSAEITGIILLAGGAIDLKTSRQMGHAVPGGASDRLYEFIRLAEAYPKAQLLICGGNVESNINGDEKGQPEAIFIAEYLISRGLSDKRILVEKRSRDTFENALLGYEVARPQTGQKWALVTSAWHMPRALATFQALDWPVVAAPTGYNKNTGPQMRFNLKTGLREFNLAMHEYLGLLAYRITGRINSVWPTA